MRQLSLVDLGGWAFALVVAAAACSEDTKTAADPTDAGVLTDASTLDAVAPTTALPAYIVPGSEAMAAIAIDKTTGIFFVDSSESGKIYRGTAGADQETTLALFADLSSAGIARGGHIALSPDGKTMVMASGLGEQPHVYVIDLETKTLRSTIATPGSGSGLAALQDVAFAVDGKTAYATNSFENVIHAVDMASGKATTFPISSEFPFISNANQGFINATGLAASSDGKFLLVVHIIDKHVYRVSLEASTLGKAQQVDTTPYNVSGNGLWLSAEGDAVEVAGDELRIFRFKMNSDYSKGAYQAKYQGDVLEQGLTYAVGHRDRLLVLNGSGVGLGGGPGGFPDGGALGEGGLPPFGDGGGFPPPFGDGGAKKLPIKVLQLPW